jgi:predicted signal transduction protein with EAL and GGDEF domain
VLLSSERLWAPHGTIAAAFVLAAAVGLSVSMSSTARTYVGHLVAVTGAALLLGPAWAFLDGDAGVSAATGLRLLAVAIAAVAFVSPVRTVRSVLASAGLILLAVAGTERMDLRTLELAAATAAALLILERWWRCDMPLPPADRSNPRDQTPAGAPHRRAVEPSRRRLDRRRAGLTSRGDRPGGQLGGSASPVARRVAGNKGGASPGVRSLERIAADLERTSQTDRLTMLPNRAALERRLHEEIERALRHQQPLALCFVDIDHFKDVTTHTGTPSATVSSPRSPTR